MEINNKRVLVVGLGKSGVASALFLKARGARVTVSDAKPEDELGEEIPILLDHGIAVETGGHGERTFRGQDLIVVSPGVAIDSPPLVQARTLGETVIGETELAAQFLPGRIVAITGSKDRKSTRLNSSHGYISYAVFCLKKKKAIACGIADNPPC